MTDPSALRPATRQPTAEEMVIRVVDQWMQHLRTCRDDDCGVCEAGFNQVRLAHAVWGRAQHEAADAFMVDSELVPERSDF